jgi:hypothetical protein
MSVIVLIYSKYSTFCDELQYQLNKYVEYRKLCIDNEDVRTRLKFNQNEMGIVVVPTLLVFHQNGESDKLEGEQCKEWVNFLEKQANEAKTEKEEQKVETQAPKVVSVDDVDYENNTRKLDSSPLINKDLDNDVEDKNKEIKEIQAESSMQKNNTGESIMNLAQQMQKERGLEDKQN